MHKHTLHNSIKWDIHITGLSVGSWRFIRRHISRPFLKNDFDPVFFTSAMRVTASKVQEIDYTGPAHVKQKGKQVSTLLIYINVYNNNNNDTIYIVLFL
jgi:hypothetical protein